jgi:hypothetical protein
MNRVTETASMRVSNGTNLKPVPPVFFNKIMKIGKYKYSVRKGGVSGSRVLVLRQDGKC